MRTRRFPGSGLLFDFRSHDIDDHAARTPVLDLRDYLSGPVAAVGVFLGLSGRLDRRFTADMTGRWSGNRGTLEERFRYGDGNTVERCWKLEFSDDESFCATAHDIDGTARGVQRGNAAVMRYRLRISRPRGEIVVRMEDWFYLLEDGTLINRAHMFKWGFKVGELLASFRRHDTGVDFMNAVEPS